MSRQISPTCGSPSCWRRARAGSAAMSDRWPRDWPAAAPAGGVAGTAYAVLERVVARTAAGVLGVSPDLERRMREMGARSVARALVPAPPAHVVGPSARLDIRTELGVGHRPLI